MKPVTSPTTPANWLTRQLASPAPTLDADIRLAPERQRRHSRYSIRQVQVESPIYGWVIEASEGGLRVESPARLAVDSEFTFRIRCRAQFLRLRGRVIWSRLDRAEETPSGLLELFHTGIELYPGQSLPEWPRHLERLSGTAIGA